MDFEKMTYKCYFPVIINVWLFNDTFIVGYILLLPVCVAFVLIMTDRLQISLPFVSRERQKIIRSGGYISSRQIPLLLLAVALLASVRVPNQLSFVLECYINRTCRDENKNNGMKPGPEHKTPRTSGMRLKAVHSCLSSRLGYKVCTLASWGELFPWFLSNYY